MKPTKTKVQKRTTYDSISTTITYPTGGRIKYKINRSGETIEIAFSSNPAELQQQAKEVRAWVGNLSCATLDERIDTFGAFFGKFNSGKEAMLGLREDTKTQTLALLAKAGIL